MFTSKRVTPPGEYTAGIEGPAVDAAGNLYVVNVIASNGSLEREVPLLGKQPTNLTFGGPDGRTVFVTQKDGRFIEALRVDRPGREPCLHISGMC